MGEPFLSPLIVIDRVLHHLFHSIEVCAVALLAHLQIKELLFLVPVKLRLVLELLLHILVPQVPIVLVDNLINEHFVADPYRILVHILDKVADTPPPRFTHSDRLLVPFRLLNLLEQRVHLLFPLFLLVSLELVVVEHLLTIIILNIYLQKMC